MIKRRFYKLEHGDKDSGSDSSCFSSDSEPESEQSEASESDSEVAQDVDSAEEEEEESLGNGDESEEDDDDDDGYRGRMEETTINRDFQLEEPEDEEEEEEEVEYNILGCMVKVKSVYKCKYCPKIMCLNEKSMEAHVASKKHAYLEKVWKEKNLSSDDEEVDDDDAEKPSQVKGNRRSQRKGKRSMEKLKTDEVKVETPSQGKRALKKLKTDKGVVDKIETPSQVKNNRKARRQALRAQKPEKGSSITKRECADVSQKSKKKRRQTKD